MGVQQHVHRHGGLAAELARQRPLGASAIGEDAAEHLGARSGARDLLHFLVRIDGEERNAQRMGARDVALLLDGVAEGDAIGRGAGCSAISISGTEAVSKHEPRPASSFRISGAGLAFTA